MAAVRAVTETNAATGRRTDLLTVKVNSNDPGLKVDTTAFGFKVGGTATNNGIIASFMKIDFDKKSVTLQISGKDTSQTVFNKLKKALPKGYEARVLQQTKMMPPETTIGIAKTGAAATVPTTKQLKAELADVREKNPNFIQNWSTKKPAGAVLKSVVLEKPAANRPGWEVTAHIMKSNPQRAYFSATPRLRTGTGGPIVLPPPGGAVTRYIGPVTVG